MAARPLVNYIIHDTPPREDFHGPVPSRREERGGFILVGAQKFASHRIPGPLAKNLLHEFGGGISLFSAPSFSEI